MRVAWIFSPVMLGWASQPEPLSDFDIGCYEKKDKGKSYKGLVTRTISGRTCQNWLKKHPHEIKNTIEPMPDNGISNHNYCRNPDGSQEKPWCYTMDPSPDHVMETCTIPVCPDQPPDPRWDAQFLAAKMGEVHVGSLSVSRDGIDVKPQFKFGFEGENFDAEVGVGDVRDGLKVSAQASAFVKAEAKGHNVHELHQSIHCDTDGFNEALQVAKQILEGSGAEAQTVIQDIAEAIGQSPEQVEHVLEGEENVRGDLSKLDIVVSATVGVSAEVRLGWCDTKGYHMVGAGGYAATAGKMGGSIFAGKHETGTSIKIILVISNFAFDYTLPTEE